VSGDGWVLVGDAFGFLDPLYSSGVLLALKSGQLAADAISEGLAHGNTSAAQLGRRGPASRGVDGCAASPLIRRIQPQFREELSAPAVRLPGDRRSLHRSCGWSVSMSLSRTGQNAILPVPAFSEQANDKANERWPTAAGQMAGEARRSIWALAYAAMIGGGVLLLLIRHHGDTDAPPAGSPVSGAPGPGATSNLVAHLLVALAAVMIVGRLLGELFRRVHQPPVIGEVVAGILLGPSLLGWIAPDAYAFILPANVAPLLGAVAQLGVILYMFLVGVELNPDALRGRMRATVAISHASIVLPFVLGAALALLLYPRVWRAFCRIGA
jgi:hypothetical protein